eukprot:2500725-Rhodomonas_salina.1
MRREGDGGGSGPSEGKRVTREKEACDVGTGGERRAEQAQERERKREEEGGRGRAGTSVC